METSFSSSRHVNWSASAMPNRVCNFFRAPAAAITSEHLLPCFVIPVLLKFLQLIYQTKRSTPFETHSISMCVATASFLACCLAHDAIPRFSSRRPFSPTCLNIFRFCTWFSRQLSLASLAAVLFPNSIAFVPYVLYCVLAMGEMLHCVVYHRTMGDQLREWLFQERVGPILRQVQQWLIMRLDHLREWLFHGRFGHYLVLLMRPWRRRIHQTHVLPIYAAAPPL